MPGPATDREWVSERRPEDRVPTSYLHTLLVDRPKIPVGGVIDRAIRRHGWAGATTRHSRLTAEHLYTGRQQVLQDIHGIAAHPCQDVLTVLQEQDLVHRIIRYSEVRMPITVPMLGQHVYQLCVKINITTPFNDEPRTAGKEKVRTSSEHDSSSVYNAGLAGNIVDLRLDVFPIECTE